MSVPSTMGIPRKLKLLPSQPAYAVLVVQTRELFFLEMWAGQMLCEAFNWGLKHIIKEERPNCESIYQYAPSRTHDCCVLLHVNEYPN